MDELQREYAAAFFDVALSSITRRSSASGRRSSSICETCACRLAAGAEYALVRFYRLYWLAPIRATHRPLDDRAP